jgi:hypothetical protein
VTSATASEVTTNRPGGKVLALLVVDRDRAVEHVAALDRVLPQLGDDLVVERARVGEQPGVVLHGETDEEVVGYESLVATQQLGLAVELSQQPRCDLDGLDVTAEGAREGCADGALDLLLDIADESHERLLPASTTCDEPVLTVRCYPVCLYVVVFAVPPHGIGEEIGRRGGPEMPALQSPSVRLQRGPDACTAA